jgi:site-specific DNA-adenine methylase
MFSYYGSKSKIINYYPSPKRNKIIEPFAGSARYALKWFDRDVLLVDSSPIVIRIWRWLQSASEGDILSLPVLADGADIRSLSISEDEKHFLGMLAGAGQVAPRWTVSAYSAEKMSRSNYYKSIAGNLHKIRHWEIRLGDYREIENQQATWFIDPPYTVGGYVYRQGKIDYQLLAEWAKSRIGQVIVCENSSADWLPFTPICQTHGVKKETTESMWCNEFLQLKAL